MREAVFNALHSLGVVEGAHVVDLFAGSGAMGIEALSRGAATGTFVDHDARAVAAVRANLVAAGLEGRATVVRADVLAHLRSAVPTAELAVLDPPYATSDDDWAELLEALPALGVRVAVVESDREPALPPGWGILRSRRYGSTVITLVEPVA